MEGRRASRWRKRRRESRVQGIQGKPQACRAAVRQKPAPFLVLSMMWLLVQLTGLTQGENVCMCVRANTCALCMHAHVCAEYLFGD